MDQQIMITNKSSNILRRMNRDSQTLLSKNKPQVRIIHIFAPEIIKTDPANFRELVQRLTGKPSLTQEKGKRSKKSSFVRNDNKKSDYGSSAEGSSVERVKSEEAAEIWRSSSSSGGSGGDNESGGFLAGFADMEDGFMQQLGYFQPSLDLLPQSHNPSLMQHNNHYYTHNPQRHHQQLQQQQHHFFGEEDHTDHNRSFDR